MAGEIRRKKVASAIYRFLSTSLAGQFGDSPVAMIQINKVDLTVDLRVAKIFYYTFDQEGRDKLQFFLDANKKKIRFKLANHLKSMKFAPDLVFIFDDSVERSIRIEKIFDEIKTNEEPGEEDV